jgi:phenylacetate-coenzyme A ligase PaaK-like adenylate-forming protein
MTSAKFSKDKIFSVTTGTFDALAIEVFRFQLQNNKVYREFVRMLYPEEKINSISDVKDIPFLPIELFKTQEIITENRHQVLFESSGTTGVSTSKHFIADIQLYIQSLSAGFRYFFGDPADYVFLALLPSYLERKSSSLVYMANELMKQSINPLSGFFLYNLNELYYRIKDAKKKEQKIFLIGVTFALIDFALLYKIDLKDDVVMETGGMKGKRKEMIREEVHSILSKSFNKNLIQSEYGMTELLSQAYSFGDGIFRCPPWMKVFIRDMRDPLTILPTSETGGINVIDLANIYSCPFIATGDIGRSFKDGSFEVLGRFDEAEIRGCNLMVG